MSYFAFGSTSLLTLALSGGSIPNCDSQLPSHLILLRRKYFLAILYSQTLLLKLAITSKSSIKEFQEWLTSLYLTNCSHLSGDILTVSSFESSRHAHNLPPAYSISSFNHSSCSSNNGICTYDQFSKFSLLISSWEDLKYCLYVQAYGCDLLEAPPKLSVIGHKDPLQF